MADRKAVNKYYPPDWDPSKGSINQHKKSHPLRARARKIGEGILVIRFEMPFNIWCLSCDNHISMGVRYNAEKKKVGNYYTTPIYEFRMKCQHCKNPFVIHTDPKQFDYVIIDGARRQVRATDTKDEEQESDLGQMSIADEVETKKRMTDAMYRLEKRVEDQIRSESQLPTLKDLKKWRTRWEDNFSTNQLVRSQFRSRRNQITKARERDLILQKKASLDIALVTPATTDRRQAKVMFHGFAQTRSRTRDERRKSELLVSNKFLVPQVKLKTEATISGCSSSNKLTSSSIQTKQEPS